MTAPLARCCGDENGDGDGRSRGSERRKTQMECVRDSRVKGLDALVQDVVCVVLMR
jgi:hypothetical protein